MVTENLVLPTVREQIESVFQAGSSNTQLMRLAKLETDINALPSKEISQLIPRPLEAVPDFFRAIGIIPRKEFEVLKQFIFSDRKGKSFEKTVVDAVGEQFTLVKGIKQYRNTLKDMETKAMIGWQALDFEPIGGKPTFLFRLMQINPLLVYRDIKPDEINEKTRPIAVCVNLSGHYFENMDLVDFRNMTDYLVNKCGLRVTRLDIRVDIPKNYHVVTNASMAYHHHIRLKQRSIYPQKLFAHYGTGDWEYSSDTYMIGSPNSTFQAVVYETEVKHGYAADRIEGRFKQEKAHQAALTLLEQVQTHADPHNIMTLKDKPVIRREAHIMLSNLLFGQFSFIEPGGVEYNANRSIKELKEAEWWKEIKQICLATNPIKVRVRSPEKGTHEINIPWMFKQWAKTLCIGFKAFGKAKFNNILTRIAATFEKKAPEEAYKMIHSLKMRIEDLEQCFAS